MSTKATRNKPPTYYVESEMTRIKLRLPAPVADYLRNKHGSVSLGVTKLVEADSGQALTIADFGIDHVGNEPARQFRKAGNVYIGDMYFEENPVRVPLAVRHYLQKNFPSMNLGAVKLYEAQTGEILTTGNVHGGSGS